MKHSDTFKNKLAHGICAGGLSDEEKLDQLHRTMRINEETQRAHHIEAVAQCIAGSIARGVSRSDASIFWLKNGGFSDKEVQTLLKRVEVLAPFEAKDFTAEGETKQ